MNITWILDDGWTVSLFKNDKGLYQAQITKPKAIFPNDVFNHAVNVEDADPMDALRSAIAQVESGEWSPVEVHHEAVRKLRSQPRIDF